jgi:hypothetical protein
MREEFLALFRSTERAPIPPSDVHAVGSEPQSPASDPSIYLQRFLRLGTPSHEFAPSGLVDLDDRLRGGLGFGLHLVRGRPGVGKTAFLESLAWEAISSKRPVLYYALKEGELGAWERLLSTLGHILGGRAVSLDALRARTLSLSDLETVTQLDAALKDLVLPYVSLVQKIPACTDSLSALIEDVRLRSREIKSHHGLIPLLLIDDLEQVMLLTRAQPPPLVLSRLDGVLVGDCMPGLVTATTQDHFALPLENLPVQSVLIMEPVPASAGDVHERVNLQVRTNSPSGWTGTMPLLFDRHSGLFAQPPSPAPG